MARMIRTWQAPEALPEDKWIHMTGLDFAVVRDPSSRDITRLVITLKPADARRLKTRKGEVLEATVRGGNVELVRRKPKRAARP